LGVDLPAQYRHLMALYEQFNLLRAPVAGKLGQQLQDPA
jgi:hypothetical protein